LQTSNPNIYAIGNVSTKYKFTHITEKNASTAGSNIGLSIKKKVNYEHIGWCIYSEPELAQMGLTQKEAEHSMAIHYDKSESPSKWKNCWCFHFRNKSGRIDPSNPFERLLISLLINFQKWFI